MYYVRSIHVMFLEDLKKSNFKKLYNILQLGIYMFKVSWETPKWD